MILSIGPELTWVYAYLTAQQNTVQSAKLHLTLSDRIEVLADDTFPYEFSFTLKPSDRLSSLRFEAVNASGEFQRSATAEFILSTSH